MFAFTLVGAAVHVGAATPVSMSPHDEAIRQVTAAVSLAAAIDTSSNAVGVAESELYFMTPEEVGVALDTMQSLGVTQFRMFVPWRAVEPAPGVYNWSDVDKVVNAAEERGMAVLGAVTSTPTWASDVQNSAYGAPRDPADFGSFMGALAERYGAGDGDPETARISAYEIWNEPQSSVFWAPSPDPAAYTELLKAGYTAVKAVDPTGTVVGGVVTAGLTWGNVNINPVEFVQTMYESGAAGYFDALSYHPYNYDWKFGDGAGNAISAVGQLEAMQALMEQYGDGEKEVWTSEYGLPTSYVSEAQQAEFIDDFMDTWSEHDGTGPMFIYSLIDRNSASTDVEDTWGLFRDDYTPKQAAAIVQAWIAENGPLPTDGLPPVDELPDLGAPTVPTTPVVSNPTAPEPVDPVAEAVANWQAAVAAAAANWAAAWGQQTQTVAPTTLSAQSATAPEAGATDAAELADATSAARVAATDTTADEDQTALVTESTATAVDEPATATDPALESTDSSRSALIEATQAEPPADTDGAEAGAESSSATTSSTEDTAADETTTDDSTADESTATDSSNKESADSPTRKSSADTGSTSSDSSSTSDSSTSDSSSGTE